MSATKEKKQRYENADEEDKKLCLVNPQINTFLAVLKLKEASEQLDSMKRRLSVLKIREHKNVKRVQQNLRQINFHNEVQEQLRKDQERKEQYFENVRASVEKQKIINLQEKKTKQEHIYQSKKAIFEENIQERQQARKKSAQFSKIIQTMKLEDHQDKKTQRDKIVQIKQKIKQSISDAHQKKIQEAQLSKLNSIKTLNSHKSQRELQLIKLGQIQAEMIKRQSQSRMVYEQTQRKLKLVRKESPKNQFSKKLNKSFDGQTSSNTEIKFPTIKNKKSSIQIVVI